jgi:hypothetical protein
MCNFCHIYYCAVLVVDGAVEGAAVIDHDRANDESGGDDDEKGDEAAEIGA